MKAFKFRLNPVLDFRKRKEDQRKRELALLKEFLMKQQAFLRDLEGKLLDAQERMQKVQGEKLNMEEVMHYYYYLTNIKEKILEQIALIEELIVKVEQKREDLLSATKERKIMEKLKENQYKEFRELLEKWETKAIDEMATAQFTHKHTRYADQ